MKKRIKKRLYGMYHLSRYASKKILFDTKVVLTIAIALLCATVMGYAAHQGLDTITEGTNLFDTLILSFFLPIITMLYGSSLIREEIEDKSITMVVLAPLHRILVYLSYYFAVILTVSLFMIGITTTSFITFFGITGFSRDAFALYTNMVLLTVLGTVVYSALYLLVSLLTKHPLYFGLPYAFLWEWLIGSFPGQIHKITVKHYLRSIGHKLVEWGSLPTYNASKFTFSLFILGCVTIGLLIFGGVLFLKKEFE